MTSTRNLYKKSSGGIPPFESLRQKKAQRYFVLYRYSSIASLLSSRIHAPPLRAAYLSAISAAIFTCKAFDFSVLTRDSGIREIAHRLILGFYNPFPILIDFIILAFFGLRSRKEEIGLVIRCIFLLLSKLLPRQIYFSNSDCKYHLNGELKRFFLEIRAFTLR